MEPSVRREPRPISLREVADNEGLLEIGRKAVEDTLIEFRDDRISQLRNNGLVCKEADGADSSIIRLGPEDASRIGLRAIADYLETLVPVAYRMFY